MVAVGIGLVLVGIVLLVAEAHVPAGVLGVFGGAALAVGAALSVAGAGGGLAIVLPVVLASVAVAAAWLLIVARKAIAIQSGRATSGKEALCGHMGVVRSWESGGGQVFVDGALWRARPSWDTEALGTGDPVVVEQVSGLTLAVRKAEDWEQL